MDSRFGSIPGVVSTVVGYAGGGKDAPTYRSLGDHTEAVLVVYDPEQVNYASLLEVFWNAHDPFHGVSYRQYRNVAFYHDDGQRRIVEQTRTAREERAGRKVATAVEPAGSFHAAEDYHQKYALRGHRVLFREMEARYPDPADFLASSATARINGYLGGYGRPDQLEEELERLGLSEDGARALRQKR